MKRLSRLDLVAACGCAIVLAIAAAGPAHAQLFSNQAVFTTEEPVRVGSTILEPGTYGLQVKANGGLLLVVNRETEEVLASAVTAPRNREMNETLDVNTFVYYPTAPGIPKTLRTWFPADTMFGRDIVYAPEVEREILLAVIQQRRLEEEARLASLETPREPARQPEVQIAAGAPPAAPPASEPLAEPPAAPVPQQLPLTAGTLPLVALIGSSAILGAMLLRAHRKMSA